MTKIFIFSKNLNILFIGLSLFSHSLVYASEDPLTLMWQVSHSRNKDMIAVTFRQDTVQLTVNTSSFQKKGQKVRLGLLQSKITPQLQSFREQILEISNRLQKTVPLSSIMKIDKRFQSQPDPHAPVIYVNKEKIKQSDPDFKPLEKLFYKIWENKWKCVNCSFYTRKNNLIQRTLYNPTSIEEQSSSKKSPSQWRKTKKNFSRKQFKCIAQGKKKIECVDPEFGIFKI